MSFWEKFKRALLWLLAIALFAGAVYSIYSVSLVETGSFAAGAAIAIKYVLVAAVCGLVAGLCIARMVGEYFGLKACGLIYPMAYLKRPAKRIAAAESMIARRDYMGAQTALEEILHEEPDNLTAGVCLAKLFLAMDEPGGKAEACALLIEQLNKCKKPTPGGSDAVLLLSDLLEELELQDKAIELLKVELAKGYCRAETGLLNKRLTALESVKKSSAAL